MNSGLAFHCHHDVLCEYVYNFEERVEYIKHNKPLSEQALRLRLFQLIPEGKVPGLDSLEYKACMKAWEAYEKAEEAYKKAEEACMKAWEAYEKAEKAREACKKAEEACMKAWEASEKAEEACEKAREAYKKAEKAYGKAFGDKIIELHKELCPNCPWDGKTIFQGE